MFLKILEQCMKAKQSCLISDYSLFNTVYQNFFLPLYKNFIKSNFKIAETLENKVMITLYLLSKNA